MGDIDKIRELFRKSLPLFNALGDPARQQLLLAMINDEQKTVNELTSGTELSRPTVSFHLRILKEAGLVSDEKQGRNVYYRLKPGDYVDTMRELINEVDKALEKEEAR